MTYNYNKTCDSMVLDLYEAPVDSRTGNKVVYNASWIADRESMIGHRNEDWVHRELTWFDKGSNSLADMEPPVPKAFQNCAGSDGKVNSAYGYILFGHGEELPDGLCLYTRIVNSFIEEGLATRHAVAIISDRDIHNLHHKNGRNDFICTNAINAMITEDNQLNITAQMRSMDAVWGYRADYSMWDFVMTSLLRDLHPYCPQIHRGDISFQVVNLHVYPRHFKLLEDEYEAANERLDKQMRSLWIKNRAK